MPKFTLQKGDSTEETVDEILFRLSWILSRLNADNIPALAGLIAQSEDASATISAINDEIQLKVSKNGVINAITISDESIKIQANRIDVAGVMAVANLVVGENVVMGPNAKISWLKVEDIPTDIVMDSTLATELIPYAKSADVTQTLGDYVTSSGLVVTMQDYVTSGQLAIDLNGYVTSGQLSSSLSNYVTDGDLSTELGRDYVITGKILANKITGGSFTALDTIEIGDPTDLTTSKMLKFSNGATVSSFENGVYPGLSLSSQRVDINDGNVNIGAGSYAVDCGGQWDFNGATVSFTGATVIGINATGGYAMFA